MSALPVVPVVDKRLSWSQEKKDVFEYLQLTLKHIISLFKIESPAKIFIVKEKGKDSVEVELEPFFVGFLGMVSKADEVDGLMKIAREFLFFAKEYEIQLSKPSHRSLFVKLFRLNQRFAKSKHLFKEEDGIELELFLQDQVAELILQYQQVVLKKRNEKQKPPG